MFLTSLVDSNDNQYTKLIFLVSKTWIDAIYQDTDPAIFIVRCLPPMLIFIITFTLKAWDSTGWEALSIIPPWILSFIFVKLLFSWLALVSTTHSPYKVLKVTSQDKNTTFSTYLRILRKSKRIRQRKLSKQLAI